MKKKKPRRCEATGLLLVLFLLINSYRRSVPW